MAVTGPHSFTDATGVEWHIKGYSRVCGPSYVDCYSEDGKAVTVRPVAYLAPAGLSIPADAPPPERKPTSAEKAKAQKDYEAMPVKDIEPAPEPDHFEGNLAANIAGDRVLCGETFDAFDGPQQCGRPVGHPGCHMKEPSTIEQVYGPTDADAVRAAIIARYT